MLDYSLIFCFGSGSGQKVTILGFQRNVRGELKEEHKVHQEGHHVQPHEGKGLRTDSAQQKDCNGSSSSQCHSKGNLKYLTVFFSSKNRLKAMEKSKMSKPSIFGAEESSDSDDGGDWVKKAMMTKKETKLKATTKNEMAAALEEDPTVFQYDEVYDQLEKKKEEEKESKKDQKEKDRKPKYMDKLLQTAKEREQEFERRQERAAQREREKEGDMYADKEKFVTSAFRCCSKYILL